MVSNELMGANLKQKIAITGLQTPILTSSPTINLFAGSMYWNKVARNDVYPKWLKDYESD